jgi:hypothetical protein
MLNQRPDFVLPGKSPDFPVVVALVTEQNINILRVALDQRRSDRVLASSSRVDQELR